MGRVVLEVPNEELGALRPSPDEFGEELRMAAAGGLFLLHSLRQAPRRRSTPDVLGWRDTLEGKGVKPATVYARVSRLSSFYTWVMRDPSLGSFIKSNPADFARPKAPKAYQTDQTEGSKALDDGQLGALVRVIREKASAGDVVGKRDYALLLLFITTSMRRQEVIGLRGSDLELREDDLVVRCRVKGSDYVGRAVDEPLVREALLDYLESSGRANALGSDRPL